MRLKGSGRAFTLIELLAVIAVIAALAALTFPAMRAAKTAAMRARAKSELLVLETAIESYKDKLGYYPPDNKLVANADNPSGYALNQLYYELLGTTNVVLGPGSHEYRTLDDSAQRIQYDPGSPAAAFQAVFGAGTQVRGFMNCARGGGGDDLPTGVAFLRGLKPAQYLTLTAPGSTAPCTILGSKLDGPVMYSDSQGVKINPWRYNSSKPRYNAKSFDLWIDVLAGDKTNRVCNWSEKPIVVNAPY